MRGRLLPEINDALRNSSFSQWAVMCERKGFSRSKIKNKSKN